MDGDNKFYFWDSTADQEESGWMNNYEETKRQKLIFDNILSDYNFKDKRVFDPGCGLGFFSAICQNKGANVFAMDVGTNLIAKTREKSDSLCAVGSVLHIPFKDNFFDLIICTEVIEHTPDPMKSIPELHRVLKKGGLLVLTVPNKFWKFSEIVARKLKIRPYLGFENWVGYTDLKKQVIHSGFNIEKQFGFNLFPLFYKPFFSVLDFFDEFSMKLDPFMVNIAMVATK